MRPAPLTRLTLLIVITMMVTQVAMCAPGSVHSHDSVVVLIDASESMHQPCGSDQTKLQVAEAVVEKFRQQGRRVVSAKVENSSDVSGVLDELLQQSQNQTIECVWLTDGVSIEASSAINALCSHWNRSPSEWKFRLIGVCASPEASARLRSIAKLTCGEVELIEGKWHEPKEAPKCPQCDCICDSACDCTSDSAQHAKNCHCDHQTDWMQLLLMKTFLQPTASDGTKNVSHSKKLRSKKISTKLDSLLKQTSELRSNVDRRESEIAKVMEQLASSQIQSDRRQSRRLRKLSEEFKKRDRSNQDIAPLGGGQPANTVGDGNDWWRPGIVGAITGLTLLSLGAWMKLFDLKRRIETSEREVSERRLEAIERSISQLHQQPVPPQHFYESPTSQLSIPSLDRLPAGSIVIWSGAVRSIPRGWTLCDGTNGTPDLRGRFVIGSGTDASTGKHQVGSRGGAERVILEVGHLPRHSHRGTTEASGGHGHTIHRSGSEQSLGLDYAGERGKQTISAGADHLGPDPLETNRVPNHEHEFETEPCGKNMAHENLPPYHALCYIMKQSE